MAARKNLNLRCARIKNLSIRSSFPHIIPTQGKGNNTKLTPFSERNYPHLERYQRRNGVGNRPVNIAWGIEPKYKSQLRSTNDKKSDESQYQDRGRIANIALEGHETWQSTLYPIPDGEDLLLSYIPAPLL